MMSGESQFQRSGVLAPARLRLDVDGLAGLAVEAHEAAVLRLGVDDVRVVRVDHGLEAVAAVGDEPVGVGDAVAGGGARRAAEAEVVLGAAVDVVEGLRVVDADAVELRDRQVRLEDPRWRRGRRSRRGRRRSRPAGGRCSSGSIQMRVVVDVLVALAEVAQGLAAVLGHLQEDVHGVDAVGVVGIDEDLLVVLGGCWCRSCCASPSSRRRPRERKKPPALRGGLDHRVDGVGLGRGRWRGRCGPSPPWAGRSRASSRSRRRRSTCGSPTRGRR